MKKIRNLIIVLSFLLLLNGCSSQWNSSNERTSIIPNSQSVGHKILKVLVTWNEEDVKDLREIVLKYANVSPNVNVQIVTIPLAALENKLKLAVISNDYDIVVVPNQWLEKLAVENTIIEVPNELKENLDEGLNDSSQLMAKVEETYYGYPVELKVNALYYNQKLFEKAGIKNPPANWEEFVSYAQSLTISQNHKIIQQGFGLIPNWTSRYIQTWLALYFSNGGPDIFNDGDYLDKQSSKETIALTKLLLNKYVANPNFFGLSTGTYGGYQNDLINNLDRTGMMILPNDWIKGLEVEKRYSLSHFLPAKIPVGPSGTSSISTLTSSVLVVSSSSNNKKESWNFIQWLTSQEKESGLSPLGGWLIQHDLIPSAILDQEAGRNNSSNSNFDIYMELLQSAKPVLDEDIQLP